MISFNAKSRGDLIFVACVLLHLAPLIFFDFLATVDGPAHLYNANVVRELILAPESGIASFFRLNPIPVPNWLGHALMAFAFGAVPDFAIERVLIGVYVLLLPLAFRFAVRSVNADTKGVEFLIFPFIYNHHLHFGFYNFCFSLALYLAVLGIWFRSKDNLTGWRVLIISALLVVTYFSHGLGLVQSCGSLAVLAIVDAISSGRLKQRQTVFPEAAD